MSAAMFFGLCGVVVLAPHMKPWAGIGLGLVCLLVSRAFAWGWLP